MVAQTAMEGTVAAMPMMAQYLNVAIYPAAGQHVTAARTLLAILATILTTVTLHKAASAAALVMAAAT